jgi:hypothetical protein
MRATTLRSSPSFDWKSLHVSNNTRGRLKDDVRGRRAAGWRSPRFMTLQVNFKGCANSRVGSDFALTTRQRSSAPSTAGARHFCVSIKG